VERKGLFHCYLPLQLQVSYRNPALMQLAIGAVQQCAGRVVLNCTAGKSLVPGSWPDRHVVKVPA